MITMIAMKKMYRQGDVMMELVDTVPEGLVKIPRDKRGVVLAEGEATGHFHGIRSRSATLYRSEMDERYMKVTAPVALRHQEHTAVTLPVGNYRVHIHHEYQPAELPRAVVD